MTAPPPPQRPLKVAVTDSVVAGSRLWRVHSDTRAADAYFDGSGANPTRFAPIVDAEGRAVPVLYGGVQPPGAMFESVFHDLPATGYRALQVRRLEGRVLSEMIVRREIVVADLTKLGLPSLGATRSELIESDAAHYLITARWSEAIHQDNKHIQGLYWVSRQNDREHAVMLFGDRVKPSALEPLPKVLPLWYGAGFELVAEWADRVEIALV